jgi:hypothetical protein
MATDFDYDDLAKQIAKSLEARRPTDRTTVVDLATYPPLPGKRMAAPIWQDKQDKEETVDPAVLRLVAEFEERQSHEDRLQSLGGRSSGPLAFPAGSGMNGICPVCAEKMYGRYTSWCPRHGQDWIGIKHQYFQSLASSFGANAPQATASSTSWLERWRVAVRRLLGFGK